MANTFLSPVINSEITDGIFGSRVQRTFGRKLSDDSVKEWGLVASREIAVFRDIMTKEKQDKIKSVFPNARSSRVLIQPGKEPEISHPTHYLIRSTQRICRKSRCKVDKPELLPDSWFAMGLHKRHSVVYLHKLSDEELSGTSSITEGLTDAAIKTETCIDQIVKEDPDGHGNDAEAAIFPEILSNDYFDDLNIKESSFTTVIDGIETEFTSEDLQDFLHTLVGVKSECNSLNITENTSSSN